ncbi:MAG: hypothetical protein HYZ44_17780 [Bacteroidetes bacterium]|nr:hypothetical protein [Bacteroidota bacterium]
MVNPLLSLFILANWRLAVGKNGMTIGYVIVFAIIAYGLIYGVDYIFQKKKKEKK